MGGASRLSSLISSFADENPLIVNSGDVLGPSITSNVTHGSHMIEILNLIGVHYGCLGNHDFDFGLVSTTRQLKMRCVERSRAKLKPKFEPILALTLTLALALTLTLTLTSTRTLTLILALTLTLTNSDPNPLP